MADEKTPTECFEVLKPVLSDIQALIGVAPCNRAGLALLVATYAFTVFSMALEKDPYTNAREVADLIVAALRPKMPDLKVVS